MRTPEIHLSSITSGWDRVRFWAQARIGAIPDKHGNPMVVVTAQPTLASGSDVFFELHEWRSTNMGRTWDGPVGHPDTLGRRHEPDGVIAGICDMTPRWHAASGKLLMTGHTVRYRDDRHPITKRRRETAYSVYNSDDRTWTPWAILTMPDSEDFLSCGAGSGERVDLEDGTILLPVYFRPVSDDWHACNAATVVRCSFDGEALRYLEHGDELKLDVPRGYCEPSLIQCAGRYFLTLRNDERGYVAAGDDGLHFDDPKPWCFDDGEELGNYNTQQHWAENDGNLYLVYTRRGLDNDHVFRHRAPLMMARVDPERLVVVRDTEVEVVPNRGARIGNFSVCRITEAETWVVVAEWMQPDGCEQYGCDNTIWVSRIQWS